MQSVIWPVNNSATCLYVMPLCPCLCPDRGFGLVFRGQVVSEEQLEPSRRDAGHDFCHRHPRVPPLQLGDQDPGHAQSAEAAEDPAAATVGGSPGDAEINKQTNTLRGLIRQELF